MVGGTLSLMGHDDDGRGLGSAPQRLTSTLTFPIDKGIMFRVALQTMKEGRLIVCVMNTSQLTNQKTPRMK